MLLHVLVTTNKKLVINMDHSVYVVLHMGNKIGAKILI